ncbi:unnamed protein product [Protopolystoma xenopodis]|uniref:Uncharacterized protein n=1 Tax=Protopolystoma xenopodis TaxID=117903 RepID=A0A3S5CJL3_9PLAT|nr:unnamed protein product [Protopolystoma xenopodis]
MADPRFVQQPSLDYKSIQPKRQTRKKSSNVPKMSLEPSLQQFTSTEHCSCHHISSTLPASGKELLYSKQPLNSRGQSADEESIKHRKKSNERHKNFKTGSASATSLTITSTPCVHTSEEFQIDLLSESEARSSRTGLQQRGLLSAQKSMDNKVCREHEITAISLAEKGKSSISHHPDEQMPGILVSNQITSRSYTKHYANSEKQEADLGHSMAPLGHVIRKPQSESGHSNGLLKQNYKGITKSMSKSEKQ